MCSCCRLGSSWHSHGAVQQHWQHVSAATPCVHMCITVSCMHSRPVVRTTRLVNHAVSVSFWCRTLALVIGTMYGDRTVVS